MNVRVTWSAVLVLLLALLPGTSCKLPASSTRTVDEPPTLIVRGASSSALLFVDGIEVGRASDYSGKYSLEVRPGRHRVEVRDGGVLVFSQDVFVNAGARKTLTVPR